MKRLLLSMFLLVLATDAARGQCQFTRVLTQTYGAGCSEVFGFFPAMRADLDTAACTLTLTVEADSGCCNTFLQGTLLAIGFAPVSVPLGLADPNCQLLVQPATVLLQSGPVAGVYTLPIPPGLPPLSFFAQGAGAYYTTITFPNPFSLQFSLTAGHVFALQ